MSEKSITTSPEGEHSKSTTEMSYADRVRSNVETENIRAIMGRFYDAVSGGDN